MLLVQSVVVHWVTMFQDLAVTSPVAQRVWRDAEILCGLLYSEISIKFFHIHNPEAGTASEAHFTTFVNLTNLREEVQTRTPHF